MTPLSYDLAHYVMLPKMLCYKRVNMRAVRHKIGIFYKHHQLGTF